MSVPATINVTISDGVAAVEICNPAHKNALTKQLCLELAQVMPLLDADSTVVVITLQGAAATFSAGASIKELPAVLFDEQPDGSRRDHLSAADDAITRVRKPVIALVDGACMGGGWQLAAACDFIVASARSIFAITPAKLGVIYPRAGIERLVRLVGEANAQYILFTGKTFSAAEARQLGLVSEIVADELFESRSQALVTEVQSRSQFSIHTLKTLIDRPTDALWSDAWSAMIDSPDLAIGVEAFLNREHPHFTWAPHSEPTS